MTVVEVRDGGRCVVVTGADAERREFTLRRATAAFVEARRRAALAGARVLGSPLTRRGRRWRPRAEVSEQGVARRVERAHRRRSARSRRGQSAIAVSKPVRVATVLTRAMARAASFACEGASQLATPVAPFQLA